MWKAWEERRRQEKEERGRGEWEMLSWGEEGPCAVLWAGQVKPGMADGTTAREK